MNNPANEVQDSPSSFLYGLAAVALLVILWGIQPFFMKLALERFDTYTVSWVRLTFAGFITLFFTRKRAGAYCNNFKKHWPLLLVGGLCLGANYFFFLKGLGLGGPLTATVLIQVAPLTLALIGVFVFKEQLSPRQLVAVAVAVFGFSLFYYDRLTFADEGGFQANAAFHVVFAALVWVGFAVVQKVKGKVVGSALVNIVAYFTSGIGLAFFVDWSSFQHVYSWSFAAVFYLTFSTVFAYGAFGEAVRVLPVTLVSILVVTNPFVTIIVVEVLLWLGNAYFEPTPLSTLGYVGTTLAIVGVAITSMKRG
ncbi:MAG: DMT family transporter [Bdellovibrionales bacterium]|nr:DMT family transporter [Bdellovibrionales bacterium]